MNSSEVMFLFFSLLVIFLMLVAIGELLELDIISTIGMILTVVAGVAFAFAFAFVSFAI